MAILPPAEDGIVFQITNIDRQVIVVKNPGWDNEEVILRFDKGWTPQVLPEYIEMVRNYNTFTSQLQMQHALVWLGYFYRSFQ